MKFFRYVDSLSEIAGKISCWLVLAVILIATFEVICRRFFNSPTFWAYDVSYMLGGSAGILGAAFTMKHKRHVRIDFFTSMMPAKWKLILDIVFTVVMFFPLFILGNVITFQTALESIVKREAIMAGIWQPPIYPLKTLIFISMFLLLLQVTAQFVRDIYALRENGEGARK